MFTVKIKRKALRNLAKLEPDMKPHIKEAILILKNDPIPYKRLDICKLKGYDNAYRIRVGSIRIVYDILWKEKTIIIHFVGSREKAYE